MKVRKIEVEDGQMVLGSILNDSLAYQFNNSYRVVDAGGSDCRWQNGLNDWLRFFCSFNGGAA